MSRLLIRGGTLVHPDSGALTQGDLAVEDGRIVPPRGDAGTVIDTRGLYVAPGFIDLQVNGGVGHNFEDASPAEIREIADFYLSHGTTGLLPPPSPPPSPASGGRSRG